MGGEEDALLTFARDQRAMLEAAEGGLATARFWRRDDDGLLLGRFHRAAAGAPGLSRRLSGGRIVPVGPGVACLTMVVPLVDWFDPAGAALRPDQVLNRALRPLLAQMRSSRPRIDAHYPGRDLVTVGGRVVAHASFTVLRDGVAVVEAHIAQSRSFAVLPAFLDRFDPGGVAAVDRASFASATDLAALGAAASSLESMAAAFADAAREEWRCEAATDGAREEAAWLAADASAAEDHLATPGPLPEDPALRVAAEVSMLGVVECEGRRRGDRLVGLRLTGDILAPWHTLEDIHEECEGIPLRPADVRKALARALGRPRSFVLGVADLDQLVLRLG